MRNAFEELTAADVMRDGVVAVPEAMSLRGAARVLAEAGACAAVVTDTWGRCVGLLRASDLLRWVADGERAEPDHGCFWSEWQMVTCGEPRVGQRMTTDPPAVPPDVPLREAARELLARGTTVVVVDRRHRPLGVLSPTDILAAVMADPRPEVNSRAGRVGPARGAALGGLTVWGGPEAQNDGDAGMSSTLAGPGRHKTRRPDAPPVGHGIPASGRVLLADPCPDTVESLGWLLRMWGFDVRSAGTGPTALAAAVSDRPDAVLMEIGLPELDGWQVARRVREGCGPTRPLLVAVSGYGTEGYRARSREAGFDGHLVKPARPDEIRAWLVTHLVEREAVRCRPRLHPGS